MKKLFLLLTAIVTFAVCAAQNRTYHGTVVSASDQEPLIGVSVVPVGSSTGVVTNIDGEFTITVNPALYKEVKISYVGMKSLVVPLSDGMRVALTDAAVNLDAVVVTGYGAGKKLSSVVGNVSIVGNKVFKDTPAPNFLDALAGQVTGLNINSFSGDPSATNQEVVLRGINSLQLSSTPLYICDGAPISQSAFNSMNPRDIESVAVLKDASAVAIYGSRGANGIILITTNRGRYNTDAQVTINAQYGWSTMVEDKITMMDSYQYRDFREMIGQPLPAEALKAVNDYGINTDWVKEVFKSSAPTYELGATIRGGSEKVAYYMSISHNFTDGIIEHSSMRRTNVNFSIDSKAKSWLRVGLSGNIAFRKSEENAETNATDALYTSSPTLFARLAMPYDSPYYYTIGEDGKPVFGDKAMKLHFSGLTVADWIYKVTPRSTNRVTADVRMFEEINPIEGLVLRAQQAMYAYDNRYSATSHPYESFLTPMGDKIGSKPVGETNLGSASESFTRSYQFTYTNTAEYTRDFNDVHHARLLLGQESIVTNGNGFGVTTTGQSDVRLNLLTQGTNVTMGDVSYSKSQIVNNSWFVNGGYDYDSRYFLDFSFRRDGSSRLAPGHRWGNFGAFGLMWNAKNEKFLQDVNWLDDLRVHYSWGIIGNANVPNFAWQGRVGTGGRYNGQGSIALDGDYVSNKDLTWEKVRSQEISVDLGLINHLRFNATWYRKVTEDMQYDIPFSLTQGVASGLANVASMSNTGIELELNADIFKNHDWYVGARIGWAYNKNKVESLWDGVDKNPMPGYALIDEVGKPANQFYLIRYVGVDPADGKQVWLDKNDNPTKTLPSDAFVNTGKSQYAPWTGGFGVNARWKGIAVSSNFVWQLGKYMFNNAKYFTTNPTAFGANYNQSVDALTMWTKPGDITDVPAYGEALQMDGDNFLENASFMRMKNLTVSYNLPSNILEYLHLSDLQLHFTGRNLFTVTKFKGYDPEPQTNMAKFWYPNTRQYEFGVQVTF